jgi:predicted nucleic acid-binding protein
VPNIVVDTSVIIAVIGNEPEKPALIAQTVGASLLAPASVHWEVGNAFSAMLKRKRISLIQAQAALKAYGQIVLRLVDVELVEALGLADQLGIYAYDAYVLGCALRLRAPLLTLDQGLIAAAKRADVEVLEVQT